MLLVLRINLHVINPRLSAILCAITKIVSHNDITPALLGLINDQ